MSERIATCRCGQLNARCDGDPLRVSVCHCLNCKKRSGSAFAYQARWPDAAVRWSGAAKHWSTTGDSGERATFLFCSECGSTVGYQAEGLPGLTAIAVGAFAEPGFPAPEYSVYEERKHDWLAIVGDGIEHFE